MDCISCIWGREYFCLAKIRVYLWAFVRALIKLTELQQQEIVYHENRDLLFLAESMGEYGIGYVLNQTFLYHTTLLVSARSIKINIS